MALRPYIKNQDGTLTDLPIQAEVAVKLGLSTIGSSDTPVYLDQGTAKVCSKTLKDNLQIVNLIYPVGSIYMSVNSTSPQTIFGGTWERIKHQFLLGAGDSSDTAGSTGGERNHTLTIDEMPNHTHDFVAYAHTGASSGYGTQYGLPYNSKGSVWYGGAGGEMKFNYNNSTGGGQAHNNMPPYLAVYIWKRTA